MPARYSRHVLFKPVGENGQRALGRARVAIVGLGALGTVLANHMVRAGVGFVRLIDRDFVEESNLQRQMLYDEEDAHQAQPKASAAAAKLRLVNSLVGIEAHVADLNPLNAEELLTGVDLILDGTDNFSVRFLINDVSVKHGIPWLYGGAVASRGVSLAILPGETPCLRCLFGSAPAHGTADTCDTAGVIGPIIHMVASYQATEAMKILIGDRQHLNRRMQQWDLWYNHYTSVDVSGARKADCPACAHRSFEYLDAEIDGETIQTLCGRDSVQIHPVRPADFSLEHWEQRLAPLGRVSRNKFLLRFRPSDDITLAVFPDGRVLVQGVTDPVAAKTLYSRYIGM
ncbi:ThiF family adenylyltransferase [Paenibacillus chitinolyticus]|uniref:ThiF family adenylyltransferase n=1 Tax=Paenibacillus chitinolyticus TaxID=79263 RepID=A0ABT4FPM7_9BACL|nr:ThiF family adenylyltransferase [Paenibacillus chitinolyticus]MCY9593089.1 ThiF family adenylyltransferase [Paenibacillus chitinolyticus]MCY9599077.1 ThiF family adenylyltransferase [Paenibacillus chitinolyticus]